MDIDGDSTGGHYTPSIGPRRLSARALGVLTYLHATGAPISAERLSQVFTEGRKTFLTALKELREAGFIVTRRQVVNGKYVTQSYLNGSPKSELLLQQTQQNSNLTLNAYSFIGNKQYFRERKEEHMYDEDFAPMYLEPEERAEYNHKMREKKAQAYREQRDAAVSERIKNKANLDPALWTTSDTAHHFAERVALMWHVKPWETVRTRFKAALANARKEYGTTGDIESRMMDRFFDGLAHHKHVNNPEIIWKVFIRDFGALLTAVERSTVTPEDIAKAEEILKRQWEKYSV